MSDAIGVLPRVTEPVPETPAAETIRCPHCEAELRNARAEPGQALRCLNCGKRFVPVAGSAASQSEDSATSRSPLRGTRDVRTPGYWLLRIPAILYCVIGSFITVMVLFNYFERRSNIRFRDLAFLSYVPLLSIGGFALLWLTKSLADLDNALSRLLERRSPGNADLPPLSGSSLPYILPLAVIGGIMPIAAVGMNESFEEIIVYAVWGAAIFLIAFTLEDVRQFLWRQSELCVRLLKLPASAGRMTPSTLSFAFVILGTALVILLSFERVSNEKPFFIFGLFCLIGGAISLGRLDSQFSRVAAAWRGEFSLSPEPFFLSSRIFWYAGLCCAIAFGFAAYSAARDFGNDFEVNSQVAVTCLVTSATSGLAAFIIYYRIWQPAATLPWRSRLLCLFPILWAMLGVALFTTLWVTRTRTSLRASELSAGLLAAASAFFAALWVGDFLVRCMVWRRDMQRALGVLDEAAQLQNYQWRFILGTVGLVVVQILSISLEFFSTSQSFWNRMEEMFLIPLALGLFHYPTLWFVALLNEMWRGHATLNADVQTVEDA